MSWFQRFGKWIATIAVVLVVLTIAFKINWNDVKDEVSTKVEEAKKEGEELAKEKEKEKNAVPEEVVQLQKDYLEIQRKLDLLLRSQQVSSREVAEPARLAVAPLASPVSSAVSVSTPASAPVPVSNVPNKPVPLGMEQEEALVRRVFTSNDVEVRRQVVQALAGYRYGRVAKVLAEKILPRDPSPIVRAEAARTLGKVGNEHFLSALESATSDEPNVRQAAGQAIQEISLRYRQNGPSPPPPGLR